MIKVTSQIVINELMRRGIPVEIVTEVPFVVLKYLHNGKWHLLRSTMPEATSALGRLICDQKFLATTLALQHDIPAPKTVIYASNAEAVAFMAMHGSIVVKPVAAAHGRGVTVGVATKTALEQAIVFAAAASDNGAILLQERVSGSDLRMLVIGGHFAAAACRVPANVTGDGARTIRELIKHENATNPERGENDEKRFAKIDLDAAARFLGRKLDSVVPPKGENVTVVGTANIGAGGHAVDYTGQVPAVVIAAAERFARMTQVVACGVDFIWNEATGNFYFIEANACPGFNLHVQPSEGASRSVDKKFVDALLGVAPLAWDEADKN